MKKIALFAFVVAVTSLCSGQWLEREVVIGDTLGGIPGVYGIVVNPISGNVYIESDPVRVFNPASGAKIPGPGVHGSVVFCPPSGKGYVIRDSVFIIDAAADTVIGTTALPQIPHQFAYSRTSNRLYLGFLSDTVLLVFDPDGDSIAKTVNVGLGIRALQWDTAWNRLYIGTDSDSGELRVLDCTADTLLPNVRTGAGRVSSLTLSTASHKLYCGFSAFADAVVVSTDSLKAIGTVPGLRPGIRCIYSPATDRLYHPRGDTVFVVDCRADTIRARREAPATFLAASTLSGKVYLGSTDSAEVMVMDTSDSVASLVQIPAARTFGVTALAFGPDRNEIYGVTDVGFVFVIDAALDSVSGVLNYAVYTPRQMIHNPAGNKLYLLCPGNDEVIVMDSTLGAPKHMFGAATNTYAMPVLNPTLNRLYVADLALLRVIDCNSDSLLVSRRMYGISRPVPVMVPYLNKLYVFAGSGGGDSVYAYDCLRDTVLSIFYLTDAVPCAVFDSRSNRIFFACEDAPTLRAIDPTTNTVVKTFDLVGGSYNGRMALNPGLGRLYYTDQSPNRMFTIDLLADSVLASDSLPWDVDTMFLDQRLDKLYLCSRDEARVLVFDCAQGAIVDTVDADFHRAGLMDDRNDKLYLRYGAVVDCRYDSVVTTLPPDLLNPLSMAWDAIDNRVFQATASMLYVYRDDLTGVEERKVEYIRPMLAVLGNPARGVVNLKLQIPYGQTGTLTLHDATGRLVHSSFGLRTSSFRLDFRSRPAGVYFVTLEAGRTRTTDKVILQH